MLAITQHQGKGILEAGKVEKVKKGSNQSLKHTAAAPRPSLCQLVN